MNQYNYLGTVVASTKGPWLTRTRNVTEKKCLLPNNGHVNKLMSVEMRKRMLRCYIEPILLYACDVKDGQ